MVGRSFLLRQLHPLRPVLPLLAQSVPPETRQRCQRGLGQSLVAGGRYFARLPRRGVLPLTFVGVRRLPLAQSNVPSVQTVTTTAAYSER